jgi:predicted nuclease of predicted toxin-antitoxin system
MKLSADESVDEPVVARLRQEGYDVDFATESAPGTADDRLLSEANRRGAILLTADKDFGELVFRLGQIHSGVVLIRLAGLSNATKGDLVAAAFRDHGPQMNGAFSVISPANVRIRAKV